MRQDHQALQEKWRQDKEKDAIREAQLDEERLAKLEYDLATRKQLNDHNAMKEASRHRG